MSYPPEPPKYDLGTKLVIGLVLLLALSLYVGIKGCILYGDPTCAFIRCVRVVK